MDLGMKVIRGIMFRGKKDSVLLIKKRQCSNNTSLKKGTSENPLREEETNKKDKSIMNIHNTINPLFPTSKIDHNNKK